MLTKNFQSLLTKYKSRGRCSATSAYIYPCKDEDYTSSPQYPPLVKVHPESEEGIRKKWHDKIKRQLTVEEKLFEINVQRRWGWKCFMILEEVIPFGGLAFAQHVTRTHLIETEELPDHYGGLLQKSKNLSSEMKNDVVEAIEYQLDVRRDKLSKTSRSLEREKEMTRFIVTEVNRILMKSLWSREPHLTSLQTDYAPRIEASWKVGSIVETNVQKIGNPHIPTEEIPEEYLDRPSDKYIQYLGQPILQLRAVNPLPQLMDLAEACLLSYSVPVYKYDPHLVLGYELNRRFLNNIPGFWPGDDREFSFISYHFTNHLKHRLPTYGPEDAKDALLSQAVLASFGWLMPLACYQGFSSFHEITHPLVTQTVLTDGREFAFAVYQLNTTELHWENPFENLRSNICWVTPAEPLYEAVEDGKIKGFNEDVLEKLTRLYLNAPKRLENVHMKPFLGDKIKHVADYDDDEKVEWLQEKFKKCCANRPWFKSQTMYEVRDWERIYKIMFQMRPIDARRRPFELRQNPFHEKLSDAPDEYVPKKFRPDKHLPKWKQRKFRRTYFPE